MAYEIPDLKYTLVAGASITQWRAVNVHASGRAMAPSAGGQIVGVAQDTVASGEALAIEGGMGVTKWEAGEALSIGNLVMAHSDGTAKIATSGNFAHGVVIEAAASGAIATVKLQPHGRVA